MTLPRDVRQKMYLYHFGDLWDSPEKWIQNTDKFTGDPLQDGFLGWTQQQEAYDFY